jgi:hypothetical protein
MKVLFLDINGVLSLGYSGKLDDEAIQVLKNIVEQTGCHIVLASSWRGSPKRVARVEEALRQHGIPALIGTTGHLGDRGAEILSWVEFWNKGVEAGDVVPASSIVDSSFYNIVLRAITCPPICYDSFVAATRGNLTKISAWVSVDDEPTLKKKIPRNFVMTDTMKGLTKEDGERAIRILQQQV